MKKVFLVIVIVVIASIFCPACSTSEKPKEVNQVELKGVILDSIGNTTAINTSVGGFDGVISTVLNDSGKISRIVFVSYNDEVNNMKFNQLLLVVESKYGVDLELINGSVNMYGGIVDGIQFELTYQFGNLLFTIDNTLTDDL